MGRSYEELRRAFRWRLPETLNLGVDVCERQPRDAAAILVTDGRAITRTVTFGKLADDSNRLANALRGLGVGLGDRIGIVLPQRPETAVAHIAAAKLGAIAVPLSVLFGPDGLQTRLRDAEVRVVLGEAEPLERIAGLGLDVPLVDVDRDLPAMLADASTRFEAVATTPDTPALLVYTSGTTGPPKGRSTRIACSPDTCRASSSRTTPSLASTTGSGRPRTGPGSAASTTCSCRRCGTGSRGRVPRRQVRSGARVRPDRPRRRPERVHARDRAAADGEPRPRDARRAADVASGGETVGEETAAWCGERLGARLNEFYGQTEANLLVGNSAAWEARPGSMGLPYPGHDVRVVDGRGVCPRGGRSRRVPRLLAQRGGDGGQGSRRLALHRRPGGAGRRRLPPLRRARRRRDLERGSPHRPRPDRGVPRPPSLGGARRGDRLAGRRARTRS